MTLLFISMTLLSIAMIILCPMSLDVILVTSLVVSFICLILIFIPWHHLTSLIKNSSPSPPS